MTEQEINDHADRATQTVLAYISVHVGELGHETDGKSVLVEVMRRLLTIARETDEHQPSPPALEGEDV